MGIMQFPLTTTSTCGGKKCFLGGGIFHDPPSTSRVSCIKFPRVLLPFATYKSIHSLCRSRRSQKANGKSCRKIIMIYSSRQKGCLAEWLLLFAHHLFPKGLFPARSSSFVARHRPQHSPTADEKLALFPPFLPVSCSTQQSMSDRRPPPHLTDELDLKLAVAAAAAAAGNEVKRRRHS